MADDKKNIGPEVETPAEAPAPEQPIPDKPESIVGDPTLAEPTVPESPGAVAPKAPAPDKQAQQTATPGMDGPAPASPGKVVDFAAVREGAARDKTPDQQAAKPRRGRRGDDKRKVAINPQTMGNYKKIKSITLRMEPSGTTWAAFLRGQAGKEEIY